MLAKEKATGMLVKEKSGESYRDVGECIGMLVQVEPAGMWRNAPGKKSWPVRHCFYFVGPRTGAACVFSFVGPRTGAPCVFFFCWS